MYISRQWRKVMSTTNFSVNNSKKSIFVWNLTTFRWELLACRMYLSYIASSDLINFILKNCTYFFVYFCTSNNFSIKRSTGSFIIHGSGNFMVTVLHNKKTLFYKTLLIQKMQNHWKPFSKFSAWFFLCKMKFNKIKFTKA